MIGQWPDTPAYPWPLYRCRLCGRDLPGTPDTGGLLRHLGQAGDALCAQVGPHRLAMKGK